MCHKNFHNFRVRVECHRCRRTEEKQVRVLCAERREGRHQGSTMRWVGCANCRDEAIAGVLYFMCYPGGYDCWGIITNKPLTAECWNIDQ